MPPETAKGSNKSMLVLIILLAIIVLAFLLMQNVTKEDGSQTQVLKTEENVEVKEVDLTTTFGENRLPSGFPSDIIVDTASIVQSYTANFPDRKISQHTLSYISEKPAKTVFTEYLDSLKKVGFQFAPNGIDEGNMALYGSREGNDLSVVISKSNGQTLVQITYLARR